MATKLGEIYAELSIEDSRFQRKLDNAERRFTGLRGAADRAATQIDRSFSNTGSRIERGGVGARNAARDVEHFGRSAQGAARDVERIERSAGHAADAVRRIDIPGGLAQSAQRASRALSNLGSHTTGMASTGSRMGDAFVSGFAGKLEGLAGKGGPIAMALVGVAGVGLAAGAVLAKAITDGMELQKDAALIQARLGVSDQTMQVIGNAAGNAFSNGWGESVNSNMETVQSAIEAGLLNGTETAGQMQPVIEKLTVVSQLLGEEVPAVARSAGQAVKNGIAKDAAGAFDLLVKSQQNSLNNSHDLLDSFDEYSTELRALGLEGAEGWALVAQGVKAGARDTDVVIDSLKEFKLRVSDGTAEGAAGFDKLGVSAEDAQKAMASGGREARDMIAQLLRGLRSIQDPQDRYNAALALFGTKFEDIQGAAYALNLDTAVDQFGNVAGAADQAARTIGDTTAHRFEAARNSITSAMNGVKFSIAEAFGPTLQQAADWVSAHKPEIISFFTHLADAGLACLDGLVTFASGALRAFAAMQKGIGNSIGKALQALGGFSEKLGSLVKHIPGLEDTGKAIENTGKFTAWYGEQMDDAAAKARTMADLLDRARPKIDAMRDSVRTAGQQAVDSAEMSRLFGDQVDAIPDGKSVLIKAVTDDARKRLEDFGFKVTTLPDGSSKVTAETQEAQKTLDNFVTVNTGKKIPVDLQVDWQRVQAGIDNAQLRAKAPAYSPESGYVHYADGKLPDQAMIEPGQPGLIQWAEPETGGEAFIPLAESKRSRSLTILTDVAQRFGYDLLRFADGGVTVGRAGLDAATSYAQSMAGTPYAMGGFGPDGIDCSAFVSAVVNKAVGRDAYESRMSTMTEGSWLADLGATPGHGGPGTLRIGWYDNGGGEAGHTAGTFPDGTNFESNGRQGVVIGGETGADDPMFTDHAYFVLGGDLGKNQGTPSTRTGGGADSPTLAGTTTASESEGGSRVFVTNWPDTMRGNRTLDPDRKPIATLSARLFADGGEHHVAQIADAGEMRVWAEPETGGEAYIPLSAAKRARSTSILRQVADRFGFSLTPYAVGGFGGVGQDGDNGVHTGSWEVIKTSNRSDIPLSTPHRDVPLAAAAQDAYRALAAASGLALTAASGWGGEGKFQGFDTGNTALPGLDKGLEQISALLQRIAEAAESGDPVDVQVDIDSGRRAAEIAIKQLGL
ncbi:phage tail tape measure protein [Nocardia terpenica]|uniref:NlpC/P60 domain-containing protein n=1 Tax=Nocardia terpenica TaxID=455432 RepID=A0A161Z9H2_9NOCA|nr:phage tail tape measure protein [Nocardia terpenica]KZM75742.1 hypothetical protein AWN90_20610 [Nocardia terpenica]NQE86255.1 hypothetical protein [Nocardia terpenica]